MKVYHSENLTRAPLAVLYPWYLIKVKTNECCTVVPNPEGFLRSLITNQKSKIFKTIWRINLSKEC